MYVYRVWFKENAHEAEVGVALQALHVAHHHADTQRGVEGSTLC